MQSPDKPVYRAVGNLLLEVNDLDELKTELSDSKTAFDSHLVRMAERESSLRSKYEEIIKNFEE